MPLDGISAKCLAIELNTQLKDARIDRIYQPDRTDILLLLRAGRENLRLVLSANPSAPRIHLTTEARENPSEPPMFCMLLRKHLLGARVLSVETPGYERIFIIRLATQNELGDSLEKKLVIEIMGRHSNIILLNQDNRIHDAILHIDQSISRLREIMPARTYDLPQNQNKPAPDQVLQAIQNGLPYITPEAQAKAVDKALLESIQGFSPQLCQAVAQLAGIDPRVRSNHLSLVEQATLNLQLQHMLETILDQTFSPTTFYLDARDTIPFDFHALVLPNLAYPRPEASLSAAMDRYYLERNRQNRLAQQKQSLQKRVETELDHAARKLQLHQDELTEGEKRDFYRTCGELLAAQQHLIQDGLSFVEVQNYYDPELGMIRIDLQPALSPSQNVQRYFKLYQKARGKFETNTRLVQEDLADLEWLGSLKSAVQKASDESDIQAIREEITATGLSAAERRQKAHDLNGSSDQDKKPKNPSSQLRDFAPGKPGSKARRQAKTKQSSGTKGKAKANAKNPPPLPPRSYLSSDGLLIQAGRNNLQNDRLTLRTAQKDDLWFHAQKIPGTHVIIRCGKQPVPARAIEEAAQIAAWFSQAAASLLQGALASTDAHKVAV
ncbi:MAG: NFACT RNA binding domain-containing protein, partial [Eubacteriales bacterium]|nr:NFACT RNA binding domain-containing protein [Eubacteriales bacterium]